MSLYTQRVSESEWQHTIVYLHSWVKIVDRFSYPRFSVWIQGFESPWGHSLGISQVWQVFAARPPLSAGWQAASLSFNQRPPGLGFSQPFPAVHRRGVSSDKLQNLSGTCKRPEVLTPSGSQQVVSGPPVEVCRQTPLPFSSWLSNTTVRI